jgi:hypothetical protein
MNVAMLSTLSLVELKQLAKTRRIKQYYIMKRHELIHLLSMPALPEKFRIEKLTIQQLRKEASTKGVKGFWSLHKDDLLAILYPDQGVAHQNDQNSKNTQEHQSPQQAYRDEVGGQVVQNRG